MSRYDVVTPRPRKDSDKPYWHRVGTAFDGDKGIAIFLDSAPYPDNEGRTVLKLFEQRDRQQSAQNDRQDAGQRSGGWDDNADSIPF